MELLVKAALLAVIVIALAGAGFLVLQKSLATPLTKQQAVQQVLASIKSNNMNANITVVSVTNSTNSSGSQQNWNIVLSVSYNSTRPCPTLEIVEYDDYPTFQTGSGKSQINVYSTGSQNNCKIIGFSNAGSYVISSPLIAIARSYITNNTQIIDYVNRYGYNNTYVTAKFITGNSTAVGLTNVWQVKYNGKDAAYSEYAILGQSGAVIETYNVTNS